MNIVEISCPTDVTKGMWYLLFQFLYMFRTLVSIFRRFRKPCCQISVVSCCAELKEVGSWWWAGGEGRWGAKLPTSHYGRCVWSGRCCFRRSGMMVQAVLGAITRWGTVWLSCALRNRHVDGVCARCYGEENESMVGEVRFGEASWSCDLVVY